MAEVDHVVGVVMRDEDGRPVIGAHAGLDDLDADTRARVHQECVEPPSAKSVDGPRRRGLGGGEPVPSKTARMCEGCYQRIR